MIHDCPELRDRAPVFRDRPDAGRVLAALLGERVGPDARVLAIPAGGVPVAVTLAEAKGLRVDAAVVSKVTLPWNTEAGYGAVAFDGQVLLNEPLVAQLGLDEETVRAGVDETRRKVARRSAAFAGLADLAGAEVVLVDDGLASGFTMRAAVEALRRRGVGRLAVAVPTGSLHAARDLERRVDVLFCANLRSGPRFAVAEAYEAWRDVPEAEAVALLARARGGDA